MNLRILLIEDNPADVTLVKEALKRLPFSVELEVYPKGNHFFKNRSEIESFPNLILLDLNLPGGSGRDLLKEMRKKKEWASIPVNVLTSSNSPDDIKEVSEYGIDGYFEKPSNFSSFLTLINIILTKYANSVNEKGPVEVWK